VERLFRATGRQLDHLAHQLIHLDPGPGQRAVPSPEVRRRIFELTRDVRIKLHGQMCEYIAGLPAKDRDDLAAQLGLDLSGDKPSFEVHTVALAERQGPDGRMIQQFVVTLVRARKKEAPGGESVELWSGATVLLARSDRSVRYVIRKSAHSQQREDDNMTFALSQIAGGNPYFEVSPNQRFALIHAAGGLYNE
jgi:hypothetical protein